MRFLFWAPNTLNNKEETSIGFPAKELEHKKDFFFQETTYKHKLI